MQATPLVQIIRGGVLESEHVGSFVVLRGDEILHRGGDIDHRFYIRSASKPVQALPTLLTGTADAYNLTDEELAVTCASHLAEPVHVSLALELLRRAGLNEEHLQCGPDWPSHSKSRHDAMVAGGKRRAFHNCSAKHAGMLLNCVHNGWPVETYLEPDHPLQQMILEYIAKFSGLAPESIHIAVDGCGAPVYYLSVTEMARLFSHYACPPRGWDGALTAACARIADVVAAHPNLIGGTGDFCSDLLAAGKGRWINKGGAEAVYCFARRSDGLALGLKCHDGNSRGRNAAVAHLLEQLGILGAEESAALSAHSHPDMHNSQGKVIGQLQPVASIQSK